MNLSEICIKRPVLSIVLSMCLIVIGVMGYNYLQTRFLPKFQNDHLWIETNYVGASAKLVETAITTPLEEAVSNIDGLSSINSVSYPGYSEISITLKKGANANSLANEVRNEVAWVKLPSDAQAPHIGIGDINAADFMDIAVLSSKKNLVAVRDYLERNVIKDLDLIPGVGKIDIAGVNPYTLQVHIDPHELNARQVSFEQVKEAIKNSNVEVPAGKIHSKNFDYSISTSSTLHSAQEFGEIILKSMGDKVVRIRDVAKVSMAEDSTSDSFVEINGKPGILLRIKTSDNGNPLNMAAEVSQYLQEIKSQLPLGVKLSTVYNRAEYMNESIDEVYLSIAFAILCVALVIYLFLSYVKLLFIPVITIPICLVATFGVMYLFGFTINVITLLALVLATGLVVDDAIVMLENIHRRIELGESPWSASIKGSKEIIFPVIAMTLTLSAVYAPLGFIQGKMSAIFKPFAFTLASSVIISGFVALTLTPMMCSRLLSKNSSVKRKSLVNRTLQACSVRYHFVLKALLQKPTLSFIAIFMMVVVGMFYVSVIPGSFLPEEDIGLIKATVYTPSGANINYVSSQVKLVANVLGRQPDTNNVVSLAQTDNKGYNLSWATLLPASKRQCSIQKIIDSSNGQIADIPGLNASVYAPLLGAVSQQPLEFALMGTGKYSRLYALSQRLLKQLSQYPGLRNLHASLQKNSNEYDVKINKGLAASLGVSTAMIGSAIATYFGGAQVSTVDIKGEIYKVWLQGKKQLQQDIQNINKVKVRGKSGKLVSLGSFINLYPDLSFSYLPHFHERRAVSISAGVANGYHLSDVVAYLQHELPNMLPAGISYTFQGAAKDKLSVRENMIIIFILSLLFIYLVLAAQFESFIDPLVILLVVPISVISALLCLRLVHGSLNIYTIIGLVTLVGLIAKHGILIVQFSNQLQQKGMALKEAVIKACEIRLRPILMTTAAMIFGAIPLLLTTGANAQSRQQIGLVITSGLLIGTIFALVLVPLSFYSLNKLNNALFNKVPKSQTL